MTVIIRGFDPDGKIQIGFYGTDQEVLQQLHERAEGYPLSRRWLSSLPPETLSYRVDILQYAGMKKHGLCSLGFEKQNVGATLNFLSRIVDEE